MKEDRSAFAFFKECDDNLARYAEIDDLNGSGDYRKSIGQIVANKTVIPQKVSAGILYLSA